MLAILNSLNAHKFLIFQPILMIFVSKFMVHRPLSDKAYLLLGLLSPLTQHIVLTESITDLPYFIQVKTSWLTDIEHRLTAKTQEDTMPV